MKRSLIIKVIAMMLVLCMLLTSCDAIGGVFDGIGEAFGNALDSVKSLLGIKTDSDEPVPDEEPAPDSPTPDPECQHVQTTVKNEKSATCAEEGYTGDTVCSACGAIVSNGTSIATVEHVFDGGMTTKNPTCIETGIFTYTCTGCGLTDSGSLPTVAHKDEYHDMLDGTHNHTCATCVSVNENADHTPTDNGTHYDASCLEPAYTEYTCSVCKGVYKVYDEGSEATGHAWGDWYLVESTCVTDGYKAHTCTECGAEERITVLANPDVHSYEFFGYDGNDPTCSEGAVAIYVCTDCKIATDYKDVPATGLHEYEELENNGDGWVRKQCSSCNKEVCNFDASALTEATVEAEAIPDGVPFEVTTEKAAIEFPADVVSQIKSGENVTDVKISADILVDTAKEEVLDKATGLTDEERARIKDVDLYDFNVTIDGNALTDNFETAVTVTIPYTLKTLVDEEGNEYTEDKDGIVIWYVGADGTITKITNVQYNEDEDGNGSVTFLAPHFSMYAVAYEETQEMKCRRGLHDLEEILTVEASCSTHGYTVYECKTCHRNSVDDLVERLDHNYGELISPQPTCEYGDYYHLVCADCGDVKNIKYVRALGHELDSVASCDTGSRCSRCNRTVTPALGHSWNEWRVIIPAGELTNGLRVRYCLRCGESQSSTISSTGSVTALEFETYEELAEAIYDFVIGVDNGVIEFSFTLGSITYGMTYVQAKATVNKNGNDMVALIDLKIVSENVPVQSEGTLLYRNGVLVQNMGNMYKSLDLDSIVYAPINAVLGYMEAYYNAINPYAETLLVSAREELAKYILVAGDDINAALEAAGSEYRVEELMELLDSVESLYAYASLKLGYTTSATIKDVVELPTKNDLVNVIAAFMKATEDGENTKYSVNIDPFINALKAVVAWADERCAMTLDALIFDVIGNSLLKLDASITDIDALAAYIKTNLPGTLTVKDAVDKLVTALEETGTVTLAEIYEIINAVLYATYGKEFDVEAVITEYYSVTLNELVSVYFGDEEVTAEQLYDHLASMAKQQLVGDIRIPNLGATFGALVSMLEAQLDSYVIGADFSFTLDKDGKVVALALDEFVSYLSPGEEEGSYNESVIQYFKLNVIRDANVKVIIPKELNYASREVTAGFDADGNYVISGLPADADVIASFEGNYDAVMDNIVTLDSEKSKELGYNVYTCADTYNSANSAISTTAVASLVRIDGKYYTYGTTYEITGESGANYTVYKTDIFEFISDPYSIIPEDGAEPDYYCDEIPVYATGLGLLANFDGTWWVCDGSFVYDRTDGTIRLYDLSRKYSFDERFWGKTVELSSIEEYVWWYDDNNIKYNVRIDLYIGEETYEFYGISNSDGVFFTYSVRSEEYYHYYDNVVYVINTEVSPEDFSYDGSYEWTTSQVTVQINGERVVMDLEFLHLFEYVPVYYVRIADGVYLNVNEVRTGYNFKGLSAMTLSDGNTLYVCGSDAAAIYGYGYGDIYYGYVEAAGGCVRAYCVIQDGVITDIKYEYAIESKTVYYSDVYDANDYIIVKEDGSVVISKDIVNELIATCTGEGRYLALNVRASAIVGDCEYYFVKRATLRFNPEEDILSGISGNLKYDEFWQLFEGGHSGNNVYIDENGSLVIEGVINNVEFDFRDSFPADSVLEYNQKESEDTGYEIWTYDIKYNNYTSYVFLDGEYYHYGWDHNYAVESMPLDEMITDNWRIVDLRYRYDVYPNDQLESMKVYDLRVTFVDNTRGFLSMDYITLYAIVLDGQLYILTGAYETGESLLTFEGYVPLDDYFESLTVSEADCWESSYYIEGEKTTVNYVKINLTEPEYQITRTVALYQLPGGEYVHSAQYLDEYITIYDKADIPSGYVLEDTYYRTYCNGVYELANFRWISTELYRAIKIGGRFYDYENFCWYYWNDYDSGTYYGSVIINGEEFKNMMYSTERIYCVWDDEYGAYRYYEKFIPGQYFEVYEENTEFVLPQSYNETVLGYTEDGQTVYEIWYYVDETMTTDIETTTLPDGDVFYHINGMGYIKLADVDVYVRAVLVEDSEGNIEPVCLIRKTYINDWYLREYDVFEEYISNTGYSVVIPLEMLDIMSDMYRDAYFQIHTSAESYRFDCTTLETYFIYGGDFGYVDLGYADGNYVYVVDGDYEYVEVTG